MAQIRVEEARIREALVALVTEWSGNVDRSDTDPGTPVRVFVADLLETGGHASSASTLATLIDEFAPEAQMPAAHLLAEQLGQIWESAYETEKADSPKT